MDIELNLPVPNTLALHSVADVGCVAHSVDDVRAAQAEARRRDLPFVAVGEGSNIVPRRTVHSFVCVVDIRGIEVTGRVLDDHPNVVVTQQVTNGVAVRMAVLFLLLGSGVDIT